MLSLRHAPVRIGELTIAGRRGPLSDTLLKFELPLSPVLLEQLAEGAHVHADLEVHAEQLAEWTEQRQAIEAKHEEWVEKVDADWQLKVAEAERAGLEPPQRPRIPDPKLPDAPPSVRSTVRCESLKDAYLDAVLIGRDEETGEDVEVAKFRGSIKGTPSVRIDGDVAVLTATLKRTVRSDDREALADVVASQLFALDAQLTMFEDDRLDALVRSLAAHLGEPTALSIAKALDQLTVEQRVEHLPLIVEMAATSDKGVTRSYKLPNAATLQFKGLGDEATTDLDQIPLPLQLEQPRAEDRQVKPPLPRRIVEVLANLQRAPVACPAEDVAYEVGVSDAEAIVCMLALVGIGAVEVEGRGDEDQPLYRAIVLEQAEAAE